MKEVAEYTFFQDKDKVDEGEELKAQEIRNVPLNQLHFFKGHPFKVENDMALFELMRSIEKEGVIVPVLVRPNPYGTGYEIISGHRRKAASEWAGLSQVPVVVKNLDDDQAVIVMVDSNLQRENLKPSEKAFAYKMKFEAMKKQGQRTDLTSCQVGKKLGEAVNSKMIRMFDGDKSSIQPNISEQSSDMGMKGLKANGDLEGGGLDTQRINTNKELAEQIGESQRQISRYIRLTYLIPEILNMVDDGKMAFNPAVELSYLTEGEQRELYDLMDLEQCTPSLSQASQMKRISKDKGLDMDSIFKILVEEKPNQKEQIRIRADSLDKYFPKNYTPNQKVELIQHLVKEWYCNQINQRKNLKKIGEKANGK